jgi:hypothetical protein
METTGLCWKWPINGPPTITSHLSVIERKHFTCVDEDGYASILDGTLCFSLANVNMKTLSHENIKSVVYMFHTGKLDICNLLYNIIIIILGQFCLMWTFLIRQAIS